MLGPTGPRMPAVPSEFPKVIYYPRADKFCIIGVRHSDEITLERVLQLAKAGILVRWQPGPGVEPDGRWKEMS